MYLYTWSEVQTLIKADLDIQSDTFISDAELMGYCNEAIDWVEKLIHKLGRQDDYFLETASVSLVSGTSTYSYPTNIWGMKIRAMWYDNGSEKYEIRRIKKYQEIPFIQTGERYRYIPINTLASGPQIKFYPTPTETSSNVTVLFLRNARRITATTDTIDVPEAMQFIKQYIKEKCTNKERGTFDAGWSDRLVRESEILVDALTDMVPDEDNIVEPDVSLLADMEV